MQLKNIIPKLQFANQIGSYPNYYFYQDLSDLKKKNSQSRWGNKFGAMLLPIRYHKSDAHSNPLRHVKEVKAFLDRKKQSIEALATIKFINYIMFFLGSKVK